MQVPKCAGVQGIPSTDENPLPGGVDMPDDTLGGFTTAGGFAAPPGAPLTHTPLKRVAAVPYGQPSAAAGEATASDPKTTATAHPLTTIPRFTATNLRISFALNTP
jgi:hypothetical protein